MASDKHERAGTALGRWLARLLVTAGLGPLLVAVVDAFRASTRPRPPERPTGYVASALPGVKLSREAVAKMGADEALRLAVADEPDHVQERVRLAIARGRPN